MAGVFIAAQLRHGSNVTPMYLALIPALPVLWVAVVAILSRAINLELSRGYVVIALPSVTRFGLAARLTVRKRLHRHRALGTCTHNVIAVRPGKRDEVVGVPVCGGPLGLAAADKAFSAATVTVTAFPEMDGIKAPLPCLRTLEARPRLVSRPRCWA